MRSSQNAPEWFGGGGGRSKPSGGTTNSRSNSRSSSNNSRRSSSRKASEDGTPVNGSGNKSERRKQKPGHKRKSSREVINTSEIMNKSTQEPNFVTRIAPSDGRNKKDTTSRRSSGEKNSLPSDDADKRFRALMKKPSFVERLLGMSSSRSSTSQKMYSESKSGSKDSILSDRPLDDIAVMNTPNEMEGSRKYSDSTATMATSVTHRRAYSDSVDLSQYSVSLSPDASPQKDAAHHTTSLARPFASGRAPPAQVAPDYTVETNQTAKYPSSEEVSAAMEYSGGESDDPLVYSEDESTTAYSRPTYPTQTQTSDYLNPYQKSYGYQNHESQQVLEHHRMMALAPPRQVSSFAKPSAYSHYGSTNHITDYSRPRSTSPVNEFYISEDETLMSETSRSRRNWHDSFQEQRSFREFQNEVDNAIPEEDEERTESTALLSPIPARSILNSSSSVKSNNSNNSNGGGKSVTIVSPPVLSFASGNSSLSDTDKDRQIRRSFSKPDSPPPPIQSVSIQHSSHNRTVSAGTATTASASMYSPHNGLLVQNKAVQQPRALSRKEQQRLLRKINVVEEREDRIQSIVRGGHGDALDWSQHVAQHVRGMNRAAGFFPHEKSKTHDGLFAVIFLAQMCFVVYLALACAGDTVLSSANPFEGQYSASKPFENGGMYTDDPFSTGSTHVTSSGSTISNWARDVHVDYANAFQLSCITALYATSLSALFIGMMMILGKALIPTTLCLTIIICIAFATIGIALSPYNFIPIIGIIALALSVGYSIVVWDRIPFAATNLDTALCGVKCSADVLLVGLIMMLASLVWTITWTVAFIGIYDNFLDCVADDGFTYSATYIGVCVYVGMFTSYLWTINVFMNIIHVTVAGVVAKWWSDPDSLSTCCNSVLRKNFSLSLTSSLGSICLGSFVSPLLSLSRGMFYCCNSYSTRHPHLNANSGHESVMSVKRGEQSVMSDPSNLAQLPIVSSPLDGACKYFNNYGFTYVGIYREKFTDSSRKATEVFETREWQGVVSDQLIDNILRLITTAITLGTGCLGLVVEEFDGYSFTNFQQPTFTAFMIGCYIGLVVSSVCLKVVASSVKTVYVCFALAPWKFQINHPGLSKEMRDAWGGIWLDEYDWLNSSAERGLIDREEMMR